MNIELSENREQYYQQIKQDLKEWHKMLKEYQVPSTKKALFHTILSFLMYGSLWALQFWILYNGYSIFWVILIAALNGLLLGRIFIIQHDCGHKSFTPKKWLNNAIGTFCSVFTIIPYKYWAKSHDFHHAHNGQLETSDIGDVECLTVEQYRALDKNQKIRYRIYRNPLYLFTIGGAAYVFVFNRFAFLKSDYFKKVRGTVKFYNILYVLAYLALGWALGWKNFFGVQLINLVFFGTYALWFFYIQHQYSEVYKQGKDNWDYLLSAIRGSTFYTIPRFFHFLTGNIGYHHIHHLCPAIPFYNLRKANQENPVFEKYAIKLTFKESFKTIFANLWDEKNQKMVSFKQAEKYAAENN